MAKQLDNKTRLILEEVLRRDATVLDFSNHCFKQQLEFIKDSSKFKSVITSRRAGKSTSAAVYLLKEASSIIDTRVHYIGLTRKSAKSILWKELKRLNSKYKLGVTFNNTDLIANLPNGSEIDLLGGNDEGAIETIRGTPSKLIIVDEAASYRKHLAYLIEEVLTPMLLDWDGTLCLMGTPNASCAGPFFDATTGVDPSYSVHKWNVLDNPFIPHAAKWLEEYKKKKKWADDNPIYLREWMGRWIKSLDSIVYKYVPETNDLKERPSGKYYYIIGIDIGYDDATAYTIGAYRENDPTFYIVETFKKTGMVVDDIMAKLNSFVEKYSPDKIVMDSGGGGKLVAESFRKRYTIPISPAQKKDKRDFIEQMNSDFLSGRIKVLPGNSDLTEEWHSIQWDEDRKLEDKRYLNDLADSCIYAWRESYHYTETVLPEPPKKDTDAWYQKQIDEMERQAEAEYSRLQQETSEESSVFGYSDD